MWLNCVSALTFGMWLNCVSALPFGMWLNCVSALPFSMWLNCVSALPFYMWLNCVSTLPFGMWLNCVSALPFGMWLNCVSALPFYMWLNCVSTLPLYETSVDIGVLSSKWVRSFPWYLCIIEEREYKICNFELVKISDCQRWTEVSKWIHFWKGKRSNEGCSKFKVKRHAKFKIDCSLHKTHANPNIGQDQVSGDVSFLGWHASSVANVPWKPTGI